MELTFLIAAGAAGGLGTVIVQQVLGPLFHGSRQRELQAMPATNTSLELAQSAALHTLSGAGLGLIFWLSWGLAALVNVSWWSRGLAFGLLTWSALALPTVLISWTTIRFSKAAAAFLLLQTLTTCVLAGLACAWSWQKSP